MASSFEKSVKGGTKVKLAPPKSKYVEHILLATQSGDAGVAEIFRTLTHRLRDSTWTVAFKSLIIVHLMIKEGAPDVTLRYLAVAPKNRLAINSFTDVQTQGHNIRLYSEYLLSRALGYERTKQDHARLGQDRMKRLSVDKGLLRETEVIQSEIKALLKCDLLSNDVENEISLTAFRLLTRDLLDLYNAVNEAVMNVLSHYFEMSRPDAERAIRIYKVFCKQTEQVVQYLGVARQYQNATRLEIPKLKHAPTSLSASLQEYLDDQDFEVNRRQYLAEQDSKKPLAKSLQPKAQPAAAKAAATPFDERPFALQSQPASAPAKGPAPDLIDFFDSIESNQQPMATNPFLQQQQAQATGFQAPPQNMGYPAQPTGLQAPAQNMSFQPPPGPPTGFGADQTLLNTFGQPQMSRPPPPQPLHNQYTVAGFGGYSPQPPQQPLQQQQQPFMTGNTMQQEPQAFSGPAQSTLQQTNPFRHMTGPAPAAQQPERQGTNPFARNTMAPAVPGENMHQQEPSAFAQQPPFQAQLLQAQATGTNPFARNIPPAPSQPQSSLLQVQPTGSTNPFRQSAFVNQQTGQGWQQGGHEPFETIPVFPRPGQAAGQPGQGQQSPWL